MPNSETTATRHDQSPPSNDCKPQFTAFEESGGELVAPAESRPKASWALFTLATIAVFVVLYVARQIITPIALALMLALLLRPVLRRMKRLRIPNGISALILVAVVLAIYVGAIWGLAGQAQTWLAEAPEMVRKVGKMLPENIGPLNNIKETTDAVEEITKPEQGSAEEPLKVQVQSQESAYSAIGQSGEFIASSVIVFVVTYFLLALSDQLLKQAVEAMPTFYEKRNVVSLVQNVEHGISRYLATVTVINIGLGVVAGLIMWMLAIPNYVLWGVMVGTLNYIPHAGAFVCMVVLFLVGTISHESLQYGALVAGAFVVLTAAESYFVTPMTLSKSLQLSPLAVILSILFWGWLWGIAGGLLAAPLLAVFKIVCDQFESMRPIAIFLAGEEKPMAQEDSGTRKALAQSEA